ncbi:unnamed protein product [Orchesella dallaii]|uniref:Uncharacterized protein n=1 Tax=Orchesella dallaii TaxID=48710 RepID=A0ABP1PSE3_9HEXA
MAKLITFWPIIATFAFLRANCEEDSDRYPDLTCHPGYNLDDTRRAVGDGRIEFAMELCKEFSTPEKCYKRCVLDLNGILDRDGTGLNSEDQITHSLAGLFTNFSNEIPRMVAKNIIGNCSDEVKKTGDLPCEKRTALYDCVQKAAVM